MRRNTLLIVAALAVGGALLTAGVVTVAADEHADISVTQDDDGAVTATVTQNDSAVANSTVEVAAVDNDSYAGEGEYTTDENGTVELPAPDENVTVELTATVDNDTVTVESDLEAVAEEESEDAFGQLVSSFVESLLGQDVTDQNETDQNATTAADSDQPFGQIVSSFVLNNNPGSDNIPDHAGPGNGSERGPPEDAGPDGDNGPPADAGPGDDDTEQEADDEDETEEEDEETEDDEEGGNGGPPDSAGL